MVISNQSEILSDRDIEVKSQEIPLSQRQKKINKSQGQTNKDMTKVKTAKNQLPWAKQKCQNCNNW